MVRSTFLKVIFLAVGLIALPTQAAFIVNDSFEVETFSITESFQAFYGYNTVTLGSSNTGYEQNDTIVMMIVENAGNFGLVVTFDDTVAPDTWDILNITLSDFSSSIGHFIFVDDPTDEGTFVGNVYQATHGFANGKNDGFIYSLGNGAGIDLTFFTEIVRGTLGNSVFLSNGGAGVDEFSLSSSTTIKSVTNVSAPSVLGVLALGLLMICSRTRMSENA